MRDTESRYWEHVTASCMTEESDDENGEKIVTHQLLWRSECECVVGLVPSLSTIRFFIVCSIQNRGSKAWEHLSHDVNICIGRQGWGGRGE